ncbi:transposase [Pseudomonas sp. v388]|uniref:REP-associated tyrosine transposase n=1 Tax=Pseudomonas sp. v388 TaxID=2479849 RepID=UPI000F79A069|nr:transposase [Pseudomonas sp. v388]RRV06914.1 transposase [Pseudomonas sp. v388]
MSNHSNAHRLRKGRYSCVGQAYLVTATTLEREPILENWILGRLLIGEMRRAQEQGLIHSLALVVMPDHFHWLFELREGTLSALVQRVKSRSAVAINKARGGEGRVWQRGFHDRAIRKEDDLLGVARYIVANPLRAGLANSIRQYSLWDAIWV